MATEQLLYRYGIVKLTSKYNGEFPPLSSVSPTSVVLRNFLRENLIYFKHYQVSQLHMCTHVTFEPKLAKLEPNIFRELSSSPFLAAPFELELALFPASQARASQNSTRLIYSPSHQHTSIV